MHEKPTSRNIPRPMKRAIRQRCGFGCVICGIPLYEYEHMEEWAVVQRHEEHEITLLCDKHHREKTSGLLPKDVVAKWNSAPFNKNLDFSTPHPLHYSGTSFDFALGSNKVSQAARSNSFAALTIDGAVLLGFVFEDNQILINAHFYVQYNNLILGIVENQLAYSTSSWDIELAGAKLTIRSAERTIFLELIFQPPSGITVNKGRILFNGVEIIIKPEYILIPNNNLVIKDVNISNNAAGIIIGNRTAPGGLVIKNVPRYNINRAHYQQRDNNN